MRKILMLLGAFFLFGSQTLIAQGKITGKVTDAGGAPLEGVSVRVEGTKTGTSTNSTGLFSLDVSTNEVRLEFSGVGVENKTVSATVGQDLAVSLSQETKSLSEVVMTGVGSATSKKRVAIDIGTVSSKDVAKSAIGSIDQALIGKVAGANIQFSSGTPGAEPTIVLRGMNDFHYSQPLIMVDGIEVRSLTGLDLGTVDRVEVVKGAAGGMLYGAQGANGVIQVFTKKGAKNKKLEINITSQAGISEIIHDKDIIAKHHSFETDAQGYITQGGARIVPDATGSWPVGDFIQADNTAKNDKPYLEQTYDHVDQAYRTATTFNNTINIMGGGEKTDYAFTLSRFDQQNVLSNTFKKTSLAANLGFELFKGFTIRNNVQSIFTSENLTSGEADASIDNTNTERFSILTAFPFIDYKHRDSTGHLVVLPRSDDPGTLNPLSETEWRDRKSKNTRIINNMNLNYKFPKFVELDYKYGIEIINNDDKSLYYNQRSSLQAAVAYWGLSVDGMITNTYTRIQNQNSLASLFFRTDFNKDFNLNVPLRTVTQVSYDYRKYQQTQYLARGTVLPPFPPANIGVSQNKTSLDLYQTYVTFGALFNQSIDYKEIAGISGGFRSDYSSNYGAGHSPFTFPRITGYFRPTQVWNTGVLSELKLRAAYGEAGIQPLVYTNQRTLIVQQLGSLSTISTPSTINNNDLQVELSKEFEIGTDLELQTKFNNWLKKLSLSFTYWKRSTESVIQELDQAPSTGYIKKLDNLGTVESKGFDITLDADVLNSRNFLWQFGYRIGTAKSKAVKVAEGADITNGFFAIRQGQELGLFSYQAPLSSIDQLRPDGSRYIDEADKGNYEVVKNIVVNKETKEVFMSDANDAKTVGSAFPKFRSSFINTFTFKKNLTLSFQWDWIYGHKIYNATRQWLYRDRVSADWDEPISVGGETGAFLSYYGSLYNSVQPSTYFVEDGSFIRLRDVSLTYDFTNLIKRSWIKQAGLTVSGRNLLTFTDYKGLDVEATTTADSQGNEAKPGYSAAVNGVDYFSVPNLKTYQISLRLGF